MSKENYFHKIKELPETTKQFGGLVLMIIIVISSFAILNNIFGEGDELVAKMKIEEERIAQTRKLAPIIARCGISFVALQTASYNSSDNLK